MLKKNLDLILVSAIFCSCTSTKPPTIHFITQGINGFVTEIRGNQMPMIGQTPTKPKGLVAEITAYEKTNINQVVKDATSGFYTTITTKQIAKTFSDSLGKFSIALPVGTYSLFVKIGDKFYANLFNQYNDINTVNVDTNKVAETIIRVNYKAVY